MGCNPPPRSPAGADAATVPDARVPYCGDGVVGVDDVGPNNPGFDEQCDDGPLNGTSASLCTVQCLGGHWLMGPAVSIPLDSAPRMMLSFSINDHDSLAYTSYDDDAVHVTIGGLDVFPAPEPTTISLKVHSPPISIGLLHGFNIPQQWPVWIERAIPGVGGPWMFYASFDIAGQPTIYEMPYPFPDGVGGELRSFDNGINPVLVDQSTDGSNDLLVAVLIAIDVGNVVVAQQRLPAPGTHRGVLVGNAAPSVDLYDSPNWLDRFSFVQFFDDNATFETFYVTEPDTDVRPVDFAIAELATGTWPYSVADGVLLPKRWNNGGAAYTHPYTTAVIDNTGEVYTWQFDHSPSGEFPPTLFGHVAAGSHLVSGGGDDDPDAVIAYQPDGKEVVLADGDLVNIPSSALQPQVSQLTTPWTTAVAKWAVFYGPGNGGYYFAADTSLFYQPQLGFENH